MNESRLVGACVGEGGCDVVVVVVAVFAEAESGGGGLVDNLGDPAGDEAAFPSCCCCGAEPEVAALVKTCGLTTGDGIFNNPCTGAAAPLGDLVPGLGLRLLKLSGLAKPLPPPVPLPTGLP